MNKLFNLASLSLALTFGAVGCDVDQTRDGALPTVDVDVSGEPGQLPAYDVQGPDVDVEMKEKTITTPDLDVTLPDDE